MHVQKQWYRKQRSIRTEKNLRYRHYTVQAGTCVYNRYVCSKLKRHNCNIQMCGETGGNAGAEVHYWHTCTRGREIATSAFNNLRKRRRLGFRSMHDLGIVDVVNKQHCYKWHLTCRWDHEPTERK